MAELIIYGGVYLFIAIFMGIWHLFFPEPPPPKTGWETDEKSMAEIPEDMLNF